MTGNRLLFTSISVDNTGKYRCRAHTSAGVLETSALLNVEGAEESEAEKRRRSFLRRPVVAKDEDEEEEEEEKEEEQKGPQYTIAEDEKPEEAEVELGGRLHPDHPQRMRRLRRLHVHRKRDEHGKRKKAEGEAEDKGTIRVKAATITTERKQQKHATRRKSIAEIRKENLRRRAAR